MQPTFQTDNLIDEGFSRAVGGDGIHLRLVLKDPQSGISYTGIGFGMADKLALLQSRKPVSVAYHIEENHFNGKVSLQMRVKDIKLTEAL